MACRIVPGDGVVPIEGTLAGMDAAGYRRLVDMELLGPQIGAEGVAAAVTRGSQAVSAMLDRIDPGSAR